MKSILDRSFRYTPSFQTDLKATFARIRREVKAAAAPQADATMRPAAGASVQSANTPSKG